MHPRQHLSTSVRDLLRSQAGVVTTKQLIESGISRRALHRLSSDWERVSKGLFLVGSPTWHSAAWAGVLRAGPDGFVGGAASCFLHGAARDEPQQILVWAPSARRGFTVGPWEVRFREGIREGYGRPARTRIDVSLLDHAATTSELDAVAAITRAFAQRATTPARLLQTLDAQKRQRHGETIRLLCDPAAKGVESPIEWLFLRDVVRAHGLPEPERQVQMGEGRVDARYAQYATVVELDGMRDHQLWSKDMLRDNAHALNEETVTLRFGMQAVLSEACQAAGQVAQRLRHMGWSGKGRRCRRCRVRA